VGDYQAVVVPGNGSNPSPDGLRAQVPMIDITIRCPHCGATWKETISDATWDDEIDPSEWAQEP